MNKQLLRVGEAADVLAVSRWTIYGRAGEERMEGTKTARGRNRGFRTARECLVQNNKTQEMNLTV